MDIFWGEMENFSHDATEVINITDFIRDNLGPQQLQAELVVGTTVIYLVILLLGTAGNILTCWVITKNEHMHTTTNFYLFSLAVSDLLMLCLGLPFEIHGFWIPYPYNLPRWVCGGRALISEATTNASILTISAFTVERYLAICHPFRAPSHSGSAARNRASCVVFLIWSIAFLAATPYGFVLQINYLQHPDTGEDLMESAWCGPAQHDERMFNLIVASTSVFFVIPMFLLGFAYWRIGRTLRKSERRYRLEDMRMGSSTSEHSRGGMQSRRSIIRMLSWVCIAFFVCWAPFHFQRALWAIFTKAPHWFHSHQEFFLWNSYLYPIAGCCYYFNSVINVIIYNVMSRRFREAFMDTIMTCGRKRELGYGASIHMYSTQRTSGLPAYRRQSTAPSSRRPSHFPQPIIDLVHIELHLAKDNLPEAIDAPVNLEQELTATQLLTPFGQGDPFLGSQSSLRRYGIFKDDFRLTSDHARSTQVTSISR